MGAVPWGPGWQRRSPGRGWEENTAPSETRQRAPGQPVGKETGAEDGGSGPWLLGRRDSRFHIWCLRVSAAHRGAELRGQRVRMLRAHRCTKRAQTRGAEVPHV